MTQTRERLTEEVPRRKFLAAAGVASALALTGCTQQTDGGSGGSGGGDGGSGGGDRTSGGSTGDGGSDSLSGEIVVTGSSTVFPVSDAMAELFMEEHPDVNVTVDSTGSGGGFENHFCPGNADINGASRPIKDSEVEQCSDNGVTPVEFQIASDALTMAVNNDADWVNCLTFEEMSRIWRDGGVGNWSEVRDDFPDQPIEMFGPASTSGTYDWFVENVVNFDDARRDHTAEHEPTEEDNLIVQGIRDNLGGIGYFGFAYYNSNQDAVEGLDVEEEAGDGCRPPSLENAKDGSYPMARPLFIYPSEEAIGREEVYEFLTFYLTEAETDLVADIGYVPSGTQLRDDNLAKLDEHA